MKPIAAATVIRSEGPCNVLINGIVSEEIQKLNRQMDVMKKINDRRVEALSNELDSTKQKCNEFRADRFAMTKERLAKRNTLRYRIRDRIETIWAHIWCYGLKWGLWAYYVDDEENTDCAV